MASAQCLASGGILGVAQAHGREKIIATIEGDGVTQYDLNSKTSLRSWAIGKGPVEFSAPAIYHRATQHYFAAVHGTSGSSEPTLLTWSSSSSTGTIQQVATHIHLPSRVLSILPINNNAAPKHSTENSNVADGSSAMDIDTQGAAAAPAVYVAHADGKISLCSIAETLSENVEAAGSPLLAAAVENGVLYTLHTSRSSAASGGASKGRGGGGGAVLGRFSIIGGVLRCDSLHHIAPPSSEKTDKAKSSSPVPLSGTFVSSRAVVMWSDGSVAAYKVSMRAVLPLNAAPLIIEAAYIRRLKGFALPTATTTTTTNSSNSGDGGDEIPSSGGKTPGRKKRGLNKNSTANGDSSSTNGSAAAAAAVTLVHAGDGVVVVVGWATHGGAAALRCVTIDGVYGAIQSATNLTASDVGASTLDAHKSIQAVALGNNSGSQQIALAAGGAALILELDVKQPSLANLIGSLSVPFQQQQQRHDVENSGGSNTAAALTASAALHETDLAELIAPRGGTSGPLKYRIHENSSSGAGDLMGAAVVDWNVAGAGGLREAEATAWKKLLDAGSSSGKKGLTETVYVDITRPLLQKVQKARGSVSYDLLCKLLLVAAESGHWAALETVLQAQHPISLAGCPGLVTAVVNAHRYDLLHTLLHNTTDVAASDIAAVVCTLLSPQQHADTSSKNNSSKNSKACKAAQEQYANRLRSSAERAVAAAEVGTAKGAANAGTLIATAACAAGAVERFSAVQLCLHPLVAAHHDGALLVTALREVPAPHAVALLKYLLKWLRNYRRVIHECHVMAPDLPDFAVPSPESVLQWLAAALDAGMSRLMLRKDAAGVISALRAEVMPQIDALRRLAKVKGAVEHLQCGAPLPAPPTGAAAGRYTLEWLSLNVS